MGLVHIGRVGSIAVTVSLSIDRYLAIGQLSSDRSSKILFWAPVIVSCVYNVPKFFEAETCEASWQSIIKPHLNTTQPNSTHDIRNYSSHREILQDDTIELLPLNLTNEIEHIVKNDVAENATMIISHCDTDGMRATSLRQNDFYIIFYVVISKVVFIEVIPWLTVITLNFLTWKKIKIFQRRRESMLSSQQPGNKLKCTIYRDQHNQNRDNTIK